MLLEIKDVAFSYGGVSRSNTARSATAKSASAKYEVKQDAASKSSAAKQDAASKSRVLDGVSFAADAGQLVALMGPNGVGKSTLFKCILNFLDTYSGEVLIDGTSTRNMSRSALAKNIAYIPQATRQVFDFTCLELALMGTTATLSALSTPGREQEEEAFRVMEDLGIAHLANRPSGEVSGGEYQLVLLARALLQRARILLMDEPTANLDYGNQHLVMRRIARLVDSGYLVITSTHDPNQVLLYAHQAVVLKRGRVMLQGSPDGVLTPENLSELYGVSISVLSAESARGDLNICYPDFKECNHD